MGASRFEDPGTDVHQLLRVILMMRTSELNSHLKFAEQQALVPIMIQYRLFDQLIEISTISLLFMKMFINIEAEEENHVSALSAILVHHQENSLLLQSQWIN